MCATKKFSGSKDFLGKSIATLVIFGILSTMMALGAYAGRQGQPQIVEGDSAKQPFVYVITDGLNLENPTIIVVTNKAKAEKMFEDIQKSRKSDVRLHHVPVD